jgi:hypothetical protein
MIIWIPAYAGMTMEVMSNFLMNNADYTSTPPLIFSLRSCRIIFSLDLATNEFWDGN